MNGTISKVVLVSMVVIFAVAMPFFPFFPASGASEAADVYSYAKGSEDELENEHRWMVFVRRVRHLIDHMREQKEAFEKQRPGVTNEFVTHLEEMINEANWMAAQGKWQEGHAMIDTAASELEAALKELGLTLPPPIETMNE